jgi:DNA-directed RNA polymerase subunit RPC12/RpoP
MSVAKTAGVPGPARGLLWWCPSRRFPRSELQMKQYKCPQCRKSVAFKELPAAAKRPCPACGRGIMGWDAKPERRQHGGNEKTVSPLTVVLVVLAVLVGAAVIFVMV